MLITYRRNPPDTFNGHSLYINYLYTGSESEIDAMEAECKQKISSGIMANLGETNNENLRNDN